MKNYVFKGESDLNSNIHYPLSLSLQISAVTTLAQNLYPIHTPIILTP